jgi:hypothetical protein
MAILNKLLPKKSPANPKLDKAMAALAKGEDPKLRREMYLALLESTLILSTPQRPDAAQKKEGWVKAEGNLAIQFHSIQNSRQKPAMLAFTSVDSLLRWKKEGGEYLALRAREVFALALKSEMDSIQINVAGPIGGELTRPEIQILSEGAIPQQAHEDGAASLEVTQGTRVLVKAPSKAPAEKLLEALRQSLARHPEVQSAYLFEMTIGTGSPHWAVGLEVQGDAAKARDIFQAVGPDAGRCLDPSEYLDFALIEHGPMSDEVRKAVQPFYQR